MKLHSLRHNYDINALDTWAGSLIATTLRHVCTAIKSAYNRCLSETPQQGSEKETLTATYSRRMFHGNTDSRHMGHYLRTIDNMHERAYTPHRQFRTLIA